jgi:drug/metabolite transporter (DMT)-like permease
MGVQVGAAIVASRFVLNEVPPLTLAMLRYAIGFACLAPFAWIEWRRFRAAHPMPPMRDLAAMAMLGVAQFGLLIALLNRGLASVNAANAALIFSLFPLLTLVLAAALGRERATPRLAVAVLISIAGVALPLAPRLAAQHTGGGWGEGYVFASACVGAACSVLYRPYLQRYPTVPVSAFAMFASVVVLAGLALAEQWPQRVANLDARAWGVVAFIGISSGVGYFCLLYALKHESPTKVTMFLALNPVTAAVLGWVFLDEPVGWASFAGIVLIFAGLRLAGERRPLTGNRQPPLR